MRNLIMTDFYCTKCGKKIMTLPRKKSSQRESGHLKNLYCFNCKEEHNMVEINANQSYTKEMFEEEYNKHNFTAEGLRIVDISTFFKEKGER